MSCHSQGSEKETSVPLFLLGGVLDYVGQEQVPVGAWFWIFLELLSAEHPVDVWHHIWCRKGVASRFFSIATLGVGPKPIRLLFVAVTPEVLLMPFAPSMACLPNT